MNKNLSHPSNYTPPHLLPAIFHKAKDAYLVWYDYYQNLPKTHKYTLGQRADSLFIAILENITTACFLKPEEKLPYIIKAIEKNDIIKIMLMILWETKSLDDKKYINLSWKIDEIGKMLGGWKGQILKKTNKKLSQ